jgi:diaminopimelate epimerase
MHLVKGHGTGNDFVIMPDLPGRITLSPALVRALCDRRTGIGADGVLRVVRTENDSEAQHIAPDAPFFMDYRNADGSIAEMCGNGARVLVAYLQRAGLVGDRAVIGTRGGVRVAERTPDGQICVEMGAATVLDVRPRVRVAPQDGELPGIAVRMPNPHVVVAMPDGRALAALDLSVPPSVDPSLPEGQNVEFAAHAGERHLVMRVHERGVGETRSCGTGICAVVAAVDQQVTGVWRVDVPGGITHVTRSSANSMSLTGPAVLVAEIDLDPSWLAAAAG